MDAQTQAYAQAQEPSLAPEAETDKPQDSRRLDVLLVEDDAADTALILKALEDHPHVAHAQSTDASDFVLRQLQMGRLKPDLILLDIRLPRLDGFGFLSQLREAPALSETPVVFLTNSNHPSDIRRAKRLFAADYVVKPDSYPALRARLDVVLERTLNRQSGGAPTASSNH